MTDRILVMRGGALGDFVLGLPALAALRNAHPAASIHLLAPGAVLPLASSLVSTSSPLERSEVAWLFSDGGDIPLELARQLQGLDLAVLWLADASGAVRGSFQRLGARRILHAPALPSTPGRHAADHLLETLSPLGIRPQLPAVPRLPATEADREGAAALLASLGVKPGRPAVAVHPGSGGDWKRWPAERFARVAEELMASGKETVLIEGPADAVAIGQLLAAVPGRRPPVVSGIGASPLAAILSMVSCYLGNDSGVTHLAAAVGTPVVALFGPTDPAVWGPRGAQVTILQPAGQPDASLEGISVERVLHAVMEACGGPGRREV